MMWGMRWRLSRRMGRSLLRDKSWQLMAAILSVENLAFGEAMIKKLILCFVILMLVASLGFAKLRPGQKPRIAYVTNGIASFWVIAEAGVKAGGEKYGAIANAYMPAEGIADQKRIIEDLVARGVD